jgi:hypothetical protein
MVPVAAARNAGRWTAFRFSDKGMAGRRPAYRETIMKKLLLAAPCAALLASCSGGPFGGGAVTLQPGQWEQSVQITNLEMPGAPPGATEAMRAMMGQAQARSFCITPEQAANPTGGMMAPEGGAASGCTFEPNPFANGTINIRGNCTSPTRGSMQMTTTGTYTATTMEATFNQQMSAPPGTQGPQSIRIEGRMTARRTGDCPAGSAPGNATGNTAG